MMRHFFLFVITVVLSILLRSKRINALNNTRLNLLLIEAGCRYESCRFCEDEAYRWVGSGILLEKGACIERTYQQSSVPETGITKVYSTIIEQRVREVDGQKKQVTIDFTLALQWMDPGIKTNFSEENEQNGGIKLSIEHLNVIWKPDLYIYNISDYKSYADSKQINSFIILATNVSNLGNNTEETKQQKRQTVVEYTVEAKATIYCNFDFSDYPMDTQMCRFRFGSRSSGTTFILNDPNKIYHETTNYMTENFNITITFFDGNLNTGKNIVGFDIQMVRILKPFIMEYYLPCMAIVLVSQIGFVIPLTAIPGRAALLVTQFLTLTNLFIHQTSVSPSGSDLNALGIYLLSSLVFVVAALLEFAVVIFIHRITMTRKELLENKLASEEGGYFCNGEKDSNQQPRARDNIQPKKNPGDGSRKKTNEPPKLGKNYISTLRSINKIDCVAFCVYLIIYFLFNVAYWSRCLSNGSK